VGHWVTCRLAKSFNKLWHLPLPCSCLVGHGLDPYRLVVVHFWGVIPTMEILINARRTMVKTTKLCANPLPDLYNSRRNGNHASIMQQTTPNVDTIAPARETWHLANAQNKHARTACSTVTKRTSIAAECIVILAAANSSTSARCLTKRATNATSHTTKAQIAGLATPRLTETRRRIQTARVVF